MNIRERIEESVGVNEEIKFFDGLDEAIVGVSYSDNRVIYSYTKAIEIFKRTMDEEEALDYFFFNAVIGGEGMPIWLMDDY